MIATANIAILFVMKMMSIEVKQFCQSYSVLSDTDKIILLNFSSLSPKWTFLQWKVLNLFTDLSLLLDLKCSRVGTTTSSLGIISLTTITTTTTNNR